MFFEGDEVTVKLADARPQRATVVGRDVQEVRGPDRYRTYYMVQTAKGTIFRVPSTRVTA